MEIVINEQLYDLDEKNRIGYGTTSDVYRLKQDNLDLAVKLYIDYYKKEKRRSIVENIRKFNEIAEEVYPIILSTDIVTDIDGNFIGSTTPYISSDKEAEYPILDLSCESFFKYVNEIREKSKILSHNRIALSDCNDNNIKLGTISNIPDIERIYLFDDDKYRIYDSSDLLHTEDKLNEMNSYNIDDLIESIMSRYYNKSGNHDSGYPMCSCFQLYEILENDFDQSKPVKDLLDYYYVKKLR